MSGQHLAEGTREGTSAFPEAQEGEAALEPCATVGRDKTEPVGLFILLSGENCIGLGWRRGGCMPTEKMDVKALSAK